MQKTANLFTLMQKAVAYHQQGAFAEAEQSYRTVLKSDPRHADALRLLGGLYLQQRRADEAIACFEKALNVKPDNPEILTHLAVAFYYQGEYDKADALYRRVLAKNPQHGDAVHNLGNLLYEKADYAAALPLLEQSLQLKPGNVVTHIYVARIYSTLGKPGRALAHFRKALDFQPDNLDALTALGNLLRNVGRSDEACTTYQKIISLRPTDVVARINLGTIFNDMGQFEQALTQYEQALELQPDNVDALVCRASLLIELDLPQDAVASYANALQLKPDRLDARWGQSIAHLMLGDYTEGWKLYETRHQQAPPLFAQPAWNGDDLAGKRLLIWGEQGLGDVLQFIRYAELCKKRGATVIVQCRPPLQRLLKNSPFIDSVVTSATTEDFDEHSAVMSLPHIFNTTLETIPKNIPYLFVSEEARQKWAPRFTGVTDYKVGLVWAGNPRRSLIDAHVTDRQRSLSLEHMISLLGISGCRFYSLQKGETEQDIDRLGLRNTLTDYMQDAEDMMDTAAIIENLDLVISVDTSVVHLAGGLGKPVWVLSRFGGCWRWLRNVESNPWYPSARVFGQPAPGNWAGCVQNVQNALADLMQHAAAP